MGIIDTSAATATGVAADAAGERIGAVSVERCWELVARLVELEKVISRAQWETGDAALEIAPKREMGQRDEDPRFSVEACLQRLSADTRIPVETLQRRRWVASRWPQEYRREKVPWTVHSILCSIEDAQERWEQIDDPPENLLTGRREWIDDTAKRLVGQKVRYPVTVSEKVRAIHDLAVDEQVAEQVAADLLRRPEVARSAMADHFPDYERWSTFRNDLDVCDVVSWASTLLGSGHPGADFLGSGLPLSNRRWRTRATTLGISGPPTHPVISFPEAVTLAEVLTDLHWRRHVAITPTHDLKLFYQHVVDHLGEPGNPRESARYAPYRMLWGQSDPLTRWVDNHRQRFSGLRSEYQARQQQDWRPVLPPEYHHFR